MLGGANVRKFKNFSRNQNSSCTKSEFINRCINLANNLAKSQNVAIKVSNNYICLVTEFYDLKSINNMLLNQTQLDFYNDLLQLLTAEIHLLLSSNLSHIWLIDQINKV
jgi:hypothetical protein